MVFVDDEIHEPRNNTSQMGQKVFNVLRKKDKQMVAGDPFLETIFLLFCHICVSCTPHLVEM